MKEIALFCPASRQDWRAWLQENHQHEQSVWLVFYRVKSGRSGLSWSEAVDEALCFGWIDSTRKPGDKDTFLQFFSRRKPRSAWSKINKVKVEQLIASGLMTEAGMACIEIAKQNGSWNLLDEVEALLVPGDLAQAFEVFAGAREYYDSLSKSLRKRILHSLVVAKRPETRQKRIQEIAGLASQQRVPAKFR